MRRILGTLDRFAEFGFTLPDQLDGPAHRYVNRSTSRVRYAPAAERGMFGKMLAQRNTDSETVGVARSE
jgi:hypothetical protein